MTCLGPRDSDLVCTAPAGGPGGSVLRCKDHRYPELPPTTITSKMQADHVAMLTERAAATAARDRLQRPAYPDAPHPLVVIPCAARKATTAQPPASLYLSSQFRLAAGAAVALTTPDRVLILSARHGFLRYDSPHPIEPYDERIELGNSRRDPAAQHRARAVAQRRAWGLPDNVPAIALLPRAYLYVARAAFPQITDAFEGCRGIGDQRSRLVALTEKGWL